MDKPQLDTLLMSLIQMVGPELIGQFNNQPPGRGGRGGMGGFGHGFGGGMNYQQ
jgi:hypothetical protein